MLLVHLDKFRTHKNFAFHLGKIVDVDGRIPSNHNVSWGLYFHHCRRSGLGDFLLYLWDSWNATREKEHLERLWDRNLGQQLVSFWVCGRHWPFLIAGIWGTRQYENTNIAGPVALGSWLNWFTHSSWAVFTYVYDIVYTSSTAQGGGGSFKIGNL